MATIRPLARIPRAQSEKDAGHLPSKSLQAPWVPLMANGNTLILGLGNLLLSDDAVGVAVLGAMEADAATDPDLVLLDGGTLSFTLAGPIADAARLIVVDAAAMGEAPGKVRVLESAAMDEQLTRHAKSVHEVSLADLIDIARLTDSLPPKRALIGIEPQRVDWGTELTAPVAAAVPRAANAVRALLQRWRSSSGEIP
ncbi:MAG: hydrogenase maturation protease [Thiohalocapsa sp.]